jgi:dienelactone hydrolase
MKPALIIISDLWGTAKSNWMDLYLQNLSAELDVEYRDARALAEVNLNTLDKQKQNIHQEFIDTGIDKAVENILKFKSDNLIVLAFSIGGTIAWKAALKGLKVDSLYLISSTRLRHETEKPNCKIHLMYGEYDTYKPEAKWFEKLNLDYEAIIDGEHEIYTSESIAKQISDRIIQDTKKR